MHFYKIYKLIIFCLLRMKSYLKKKFPVYNQNVINETSFRIQPYLIPVKMAAKLACIKKRTCKKTVFIDLFKVNDQNLPRTVCTARCKFVDPDSLLPR